MNGNVGDAPCIALRLHLQQPQRKAVHDVMDILSLSADDRWAPVHVTTGKSEVDTLTQANRSGLKQQRMAKVKPDMILTPSISVVIFTVDTDLQLSTLEASRQTFDKTPWRFHHLTEVNTTKQLTNRIHAKQAFYELAPDFPLFSLSTIHFGKQILRINIVTYNHSEMMDFYTRLFHRPPVCVRPDFSYFTFPYRKNTILQFALKSASKLMPYPTDNAELVLSIRDLPSDLQLNKVSDDLSSLVDPDNNYLLIHSLKVDLNCDPSFPSDILCKQSDLVVETDKKVLDLNKETWKKDTCRRPDVIPSQDCCTASSQSYSSMRSVAPRIKTVRTKFRSGSPVIHRKQLVISNISGSQDCLIETNNNGGGFKRRNSIDVLESF